MVNCLRIPWSHGPENGPSWSHGPAYAPEAVHVSGQGVPQCRHPASFAGDF